jgi:hypothetical protein
MTDYMFHGAVVCTMLSLALVFAVGALYMLQQKRLGMMVLCGAGYVFELWLSASYVQHIGYVPW